PARRRLEPGLRGRDRTPGRGPPGRTPADPARGRPAQPRDPHHDEGRRGPPRRQRRGGRRADPAAADPVAHGRRLEADEDRGLPPAGRPSHAGRVSPRRPLRARRAPRLAGRAPPYGETAFRPTTPATISAMHASRAGEALSANSTMPTVATPMAPIPVQIA